MEELRRKELRELVGLKAIGLLCCPADYTIPPRAPKPSSGLVEQQYCSQKRGNVIEVIRAAAACKGCANASNGNFASSDGLASSVRISGASLSSTSGRSCMI